MSAISFDFGAPSEHRGENRAPRDNVGVTMSKSNAKHAKYTQFSNYLSKQLPLQISVSILDIAAPREVCPVFARSEIALSPHLSEQDVASLQKLRWDHFRPKATASSQSRIFQSLQVTSVTSDFLVDVSVLGFRRNVFRNAMIFLPISPAKMSQVVSCVSCVVMIFPSLRV